MTTLSHPMIEKWKPAAMALTTVNESLSLPTHVLIGEAIDVARFAQRRWKTARDGEGAIVAPGLDPVRCPLVTQAGGSGSPEGGPRRKFRVDSGPRHFHDKKTTGPPVGCSTSSTLRSLLPIRRWRVRPSFARS